MTYVHRVPRLLATAVATTGLLLAGAAPASAERLSRSDPRGDVVRYAEVTPADTAEFEPRPKRRMGDIVRTVARHTDERIILRTRYARLTHKQGNPFRVTWLVQTPELPSASITLDAWPDQWHGVLEVHYGRGRVSAASENCSGDHRIKYRRNSVRIVLPRECLGDPGSVRVGTKTRFFRGGFVFGDDGLRRSYENAYQMSRELTPG